MNLKFHWMFNNSTASIDLLKEYSDVLDLYNYESMLLVYDPFHQDFLIRVANIIDKNQKIKYMFAIRTYSISPEFLAMMYKSFNEIHKNRIVFNICAGDKPQMDREANIIDGMVDLDILKNNTYERILYTRKWTEKFVNLKTMTDLPYLVFSGTSDYTLETAGLYGDSTLCMYNSFIENPEKFNVTKKRMISVAVAIAENKDEEEKIMASSYTENAKNWTIIGTKEYIKQEFIKLKNIGVTDILIVNPFTLQDNNKIHDFIKSIEV